MSLDEETKRPIIVVADTHLGLLRKYPKVNLGGLLSNEMESDSVELCHFLEWVEGLDKKPETLPLGRWGKSGEEFTIRRPGTIILLGDFLELWDASDAAVDFASREIWRTLAEIAEKNVKIVYVIGNHDFAIRDLAEDKTPGGKRGRFFPIGDTKVEMIEDTYPVKYARRQSTAVGLPPSQEAPGNASKPPTQEATNEGTLDTISVEKMRYVFLHGQQFDTLFRFIRAWTVMSYIRDGAEAFRLYSWLILGFTVLWALLARTLNVFHWTPIVLLLMLGAGPRFAVWVARPLFNKAKLLPVPKWLLNALRMLQTTRYNSRKALDGFLNWWEDLHRKKKIPQDLPITVVYGHTHLAEIFKQEEINDALDQQEKRHILVRGFWAFLRLLRGKIGPVARVQEDVVLINVPAWVGDLSSGHEPVLRDAALYIDEQGAKFIGWRWPRSLGPQDPGGPFYVPDEIVRRRADGKGLDPQTRDDLMKLNWPPRMLGYWKEEYKEPPFSAGVKRA